MDPRNYRALFSGKYVPLDHVHSPEYFYIVVQMLHLEASIDSVMV